MAVTPSCFDKNTDALINDVTEPRKYDGSVVPLEVVETPLLKDWAVSILAIPHETQRYSTIGDWRYNDAFGQMTLWDIRVSKMSDWRYEFLVALHEFVEMGLCHEAGIREEDVTAFDIQFESEREHGIRHEDEEPGDDVRAPYHAQHRIANMVEKFVASKLHVNWHAYEQEVNSL